MDALAQSVCQQLISQLKLSHLNYLVTETPYSAQITIRKRFLKEYSGPNSNFFLFGSDVKNLESQIKELTDENAILKKEIANEKDAKKIDKDNIEVLEGKIKHAEAEALKAYERSKVETSSLKNVNKNLNTEHEQLKSDLNLRSKNLKQKEKEVTKLQMKVDNLENTVKEIRCESKNLKAEHKRLEKSLKLAKTPDASNHALSNKKDRNKIDSNQNIPEVSMSEPSVHQIALPTTIATSPPTTPTPAPSSPSPWSASVQQTLPGSQISPLTPPEKPVLTLPSSDIQPQAASASASNLLESSTVSISADYIVGINDIDLGPRINDLSKM